MQKSFILLGRPMIFNLVFDTEMRERETERERMKFLSHIILLTKPQSSNLLQIYFIIIAVLKHLEQLQER